MKFLLEWTFQRFTAQNGLQFQDKDDPDQGESRGQIRVRRLQGRPRDLRSRLQGQTERWVRELTEGQPFEGRLMLDLLFWRSDDREYALKQIEGAGLSMSACREIAVKQTLPKLFNKVILGCRCIKCCSSFSAFEGTEASECDHVAEGFLVTSR